MTFTPQSRRAVGRTGLELPLMGLGTAHLGELYSKVPEADARATLEAAWAQGIRYYDTAPWYGRGLAEHRTGGFLRTCPRSEFRVSTKVGRTLHRPADLAHFSRDPWVGGLNFEVRFDYSRDGILRSYEQALQRLALDTVDALVIHDIDAGFHAPQVYARHRRDLAATGIAALQELKRSGDISAYGIGINSNEAFATALPDIEVDFALVAMPYTLLDQDSLDRGMKYCTDNGIGVIIGAPFASGILVTGSKGAKKYGYADAPEAVQAKVRAIEAVAEAHSVPLAAAALQFPLAHPAVASIIPGAARPQEVTQNLASLAHPIPAAFWSDLKAQGLIVPDAPIPGRA